MSTPRPSAGGGTRWVAAACGVLLLIGLALVIYAVAGQTGAPPQPPRSAAGSEATGEPVPGPAAGSENSGAARPGSAAGSESTGADGATADRGADPASGADSKSGADSAPMADSVPAPMPASEPVTVRSDAIGLESEVFPIGLTADGSLAAPSGDRANLAAWFEGSPTPGQNGPAVIEGHVTWSDEPSVFFELGALQPGDRVSVDREDGSTATFEVYETGRYPKEDFPTWRVYGNTPGPELRLITCGGEISDETGNHVDNVVVYLKLVSD